MNYLYYPGCSLESNGKAYDLSLRSVFKLLGCPLEELPDWNCCGATAYMSVKESIAFSISARNLALAEPLGSTLVAPCSSCFTILNKTNRYLKENRQLNRTVGEALSSGGLKYEGTVTVRHPLDVLVNEIGIKTIASRLVRSLVGLRVANYYGCQIVRPESGFDDQESPESMEALFSGLGAENVYFPVRLRCCGGMLMSTFNEVGLKLNRDILRCASENGADVVLTTCPMCHINLEGYQGAINRKFGSSFRVPILYFTQLLGWALGAGSGELGLAYNLEPPELKILLAEKV